MKQLLRMTIFGLGLAGPILALGVATTPRAAAQEASIAAVVNGEVITSADVEARARLLALSSGLPPTPAALDRLKPQITEELVNQTLQLQEIARRKVAVPETDIAAAIGRIEQGNNLPAGGLRARMAQDGIPFSTLIAQIRTQLGWQTVLHQVLGPGLQPSPGDMAAEATALKNEIGTTQYHLAEIFIQVPDPAQDQTAKNFASTVIQQLRAGAPFPVVAAQFSQATTALQGGDLGFVSLDQLDPAVAAVVSSMPVGAISNPIRVPGGYDIVQLQETHKVGTSTNTALDIRQVFAPYPSPITNGQVGPGQLAVINKLVQASHAVTSCAEMDGLNASFGNSRPDNPGSVSLADVTPPAFQQLLANLPIGKISQPLVAQDGVSVVMVCSRQVQPVGLPSNDQIRDLIVERRVQLESQQLLDDLRHRSIISQ
jgi:peptidyl-prolyl cis-trans isomerase SurA